MRSIAIVHSISIEGALASLPRPVRDAFLRAVAIDVLPYWTASPSVVGYLWTGVGALAPIDTRLVDTEVEQAAARAALSTANAWHHATRTIELLRDERAATSARRDLVVAARYLEGWTELDLTLHRPVWEALEGTVPLTRILTWGDLEDAWVMADQSMHPVAAGECLHTAAFSGDLGTVLALLAKGVDPNQTKRSPDWPTSAIDPTPLHSALVGPSFNEQHLEVMRALVRAGARVEQTHLTDHANESCGTPAEIGAGALLQLHRSAP